MKQLFGLFLALLTASALLTGCGVAPIALAQDDLSVSLATEPAPPLAGRVTTLTLAIQQAGAPFDGATVGLRRSMPGMEHQGDHELVPAEPLSGGRYRATTSFVMGGRWDLAVVVTGHDGVAHTLVFPVEVEQP